MPCTLISPFCSCCVNEWSKTFLIPSAFSSSIWIGKFKEIKSQAWFGFISYSMHAELCLTINFSFFEGLIGNFWISFGNEIEYSYLKRLHAILLHSTLNLLFTAFFVPKRMWYFLTCFLVNTITPNVKLGLFLIFSTLPSVNALHSLKFYLSLLITFVK